MSEKGYKEFAHPINTDVQEIIRPDLPPGPTWRCPSCAATIRTNEIHNGRHHLIIFINGKPRFYQDAR